MGNSLQRINPHYSRGFVTKCRSVRDKREERDSRDVWALSLPVALFSPVSPISLESGIGGWSRSIRE
jgi:hypothetical protein